jgi:hypothetical protein
MENENRIEYPIQTIREGNKITKICVEDFYKMLNRICDEDIRGNKEFEEIWDSLDVEVPNKDGEKGIGCLIVGTGISQPNIQDAFDEEIGNNIAFMKAKLNANIKKHNILCRIWNNLSLALDKIDEDLEKVDKYIELDLNGIRNYNPDYLKGLEFKLGL